MPAVFPQKRAGMADQRELQIVAGSRADRARELDVMHDRVADLPTMIAIVEENEDHGRGAA